MVVIAARPTLETGTWHERVASPFMCTVHAPHCATPQPYLVPVSPSASRSTQRSGVSAATSAVSRFPFTESVYFMSGAPPAGPRDSSACPAGVGREGAGRSKVRAMIGRREFLRRLGRAGTGAVVAGAVPGWARGAMRMAPADAAAAGKHPTPEADLIVRNTWPEHYETSL